MTTIFVFTAVNVKEPLSDYLPSSLRELEDMGHLLSQKDFELGSQTSATFIRTASLAADMSDLKHSEALPVFFIPAFCETQLRPLISKLIYPCYVAHMRPDVMSAWNIADQLFEVRIFIHFFTVKRLLIYCFYSASAIPYHH